jgi:NADH-quinone oxidoreductase subunit E
MVNWEFFDNQTPESATALVDGLRAGDLPTPTRGASLCTFKQVSRVLAGFYDGRADEGPAAGPATLAGLEIYREQQEAEREGRHSVRKSPTTDKDGDA